MNIHELRGRRAELMRELDEIDDIIESYGVHVAVRVNSRAKLRKISGVRLDTKRYNEGELLVYEDEYLTRFSGEDSRSGYATMQNWKEYEMSNFFDKGRIWCEK